MDISINHQEDFEAAARAIVLDTKDYSAFKPHMADTCPDVRGCASCMCPLDGRLNAKEVADALSALEVGDALAWARLYPDALTLYRHIADNHPNNSRAITAQRKVATTYINLENEPAAQQSLDELTLRFADDPKISEELYEVGECYRMRKDYLSARPHYDYIAAEFPQTNDALWSRQRCMLMDNRARAAISSGVNGRS